MVNQDRNVFAACMVACGDADAMVTGLTRGWMGCFEDIERVIDPKPGERPLGLMMMVGRGRTLFIADTTVHGLPGPAELADIAVQVAAFARHLGHEPQVALLSFSDFGNPWREKAQRVRDAVAELDRRKVDFAYDGDITADMALDPELRARFFPFCRLKGPANVLIMPALHTADISTRLLQQLGAGTMIGPLVLGLSKPAQIVQLRAGVTDVVQAAALAAYQAVR
jgi:malate dehydrogenase (oxaloacetate-decarboxylating)(NADP+)